MTIALTIEDPEGYFVVYRENGTLHGYTKLNDGYEATYPVKGGTMANLFLEIEEMHHKYMFKDKLKA